MDFELDIHEQKASADAQLILKNLAEFNNQYRRSGETFRELTVTIKDSAGSLLAGLNGQTDWGWLFVKMLWVREDHHGRKLGTKLMLAAEQESRQRGCKNAWVDTFNPRAKIFYERLGYKVFGQLIDHPLGKTRYFFSRRLS